MKSLIVLTIALLLPLTAFASKKKQQTARDSTETSPTLQETSDWLAKTLEAYGGKDDERVSNVISNAHIDDHCNFSFEQTNHSLRASGRTYIWQISLPLGAVTLVEPEILRSSDAEVGVRIWTGDVNAVVQTGQEGRHVGATFATIDVARSPQGDIGAQVPQNPDQMVPRIVNALQHAVSLCQGTYEPPAPAKEPF